MKSKRVSENISYNYYPFFSSNKPVDPKETQSII